jgi:8-oxo-dGTP pyrophosphatase MutT (NUDIX family)
MDIKDRELHRIVITAIIYNSDKQFLITKRSPTKKAFPNLWTVPGGGLTIDDYINTPKTFEGFPQWYNALEKTLRREVKEEVNIEVDKPWYVLDLTFIRPDNIPVLVLSYAAAYMSGDIKLDEDSVEYAWVTFEEAKKYNLIDGILHELELVDKKIREKDTQ